MSGFFKGNSHEINFWTVPVMGVMCILAAWLIAFNLGQTTGEREREAFEQSRQAQLASCERVNDLRREVNVHVDVLDAFLFEAALAREVAGTETDLEVALTYKQLAQELQLLNIVDCNAVFPDYFEESL